MTETSWPDLMRAALSARTGRISSVTLLRRPGSESRRNRICRSRVEAFHGAGIPVDGEDLATVTSYITSRIRRFGD